MNDDTSIDFVYFGIIESEPSTSLSDAQLDSCVSSGWRNGRGSPFKRDYELRRRRGAGRHFSAAILRPDLMEWYSIIRHSVDTKIMVRFPKAVLLVKAQNATARLSGRVPETRYQTRMREDRRAVVKIRACGVQDHAAAPEPQV